MCTLYSEMVGSLVEFNFAYDANAIHHEVWAGWCIHIQDPTIVHRPIAAVQYMRNYVWRTYANGDFYTVHCAVRSTYRDDNANARPHFMIYNIGSEIKRLPHSMG